MTSNPDFSNYILLFCVPVFSLWMMVGWYFQCKRMKNIVIEDSRKDMQKLHEHYDLEIKKIEQEHKEQLDGVKLDRKIAYVSYRIMLSSITTLHRDASAMVKQLDKEMQEHHGVLTELITHSLRLMTSMRAETMNSEIKIDYTRLNLLSEEIDVLNNRFGLVKAAYMRRYE